MLMMLDKKYLLYKTVFALTKNARFKKKDKQEKNILQKVGGVRN